MPISLRLPVNLETQIAGFGLRAGMSKTAVVVRSIQEFLARNAQPTSRQIYDDAMREAQQGPVRADGGRKSEAAEPRAHKREFRAAIRVKQARRSEPSAPVKAKPKRALGNAGSAGNAGGPA